MHSCANCEPKFGNYSELNDHKLNTHPEDQKVYKKFGHTFILYKTGKIICVGGKDIGIIENL